MLSSLEQLGASIKFSVVALSLLFSHVPCFVRAKHVGYESFGFISSSGYVSNLFSSSFAFWNHVIL